MAKFNMDNILSLEEDLVETAVEGSKIGRDEDIPADLIDGHPENYIFAAADTDEGLESLAESISIRLNNRLIVSYHEDSGRYVILSGHRRYRALTEYLHRELIPCTVYEHMTPLEETLVLYEDNLEVREYSAKHKFNIYLLLYKHMKEQNDSVPDGEKSRFNIKIREHISAVLKVSERQLSKYKFILDNTNEEEQKYIIGSDISVNDILKIATSRSLGDTDSVIIPPSDQSDKPEDSRLPIYDTESIHDSDELQNELELNGIALPGSLGRLVGASYEEMKEILDEELAKNPPKEQVTKEVTYSANQLQAFSRKRFTYLLRERDKLTGEIVAKAKCELPKEEIIQRLSEYENLGRTPDELEALLETLFQMLKQGKEEPTE